MEHVSRALLWTGNQEEDIVLSRKIPKQFVLHQHEWEMWMFGKEVFDGGLERGGNCIENVKGL